jgi:hypothetical protein
MTVPCHTPYHIAYFSIGETEGRYRFEFHTNVVRVRSPLGVSTGAA